MKERGMKNKVSKGGKERRDGNRKEGEEGRSMGGGVEYDHFNQRQRGFPEPTQQILSVCVIMLISWR